MFLFFAERNFAQKASTALFQEVNGFPEYQYSNEVDLALLNQNVVLIGQFKKYPSQVDSLVLETYEAQLALGKVLFKTHKIAPTDFVIPSNSWVKIWATQQETFLRIDSLAVVPKMDKITNDAAQKCSKWFRVNKKYYDINNFKKSPYFIQARLAHVKNKNFNKTIFKFASEVKGLDAKASLLFINLGMNILYEDKIQRGDFISFVAVYDYKKQQIEKILVYNSGYFLE